MMKNKQLMGQGVFLLSAAAVFWIYRRRYQASKRSNEINWENFNPNEECDDKQLQEDFEKAASVVKAFPSGHLDQRDQLMIYGLYKQALFGDRTGDSPLKVNIIATEKYKAWGKFTGLSKPFAMMKYIEIVHHFSMGGKSCFIDSANNENDDIEYEEDEHVDEDGCPLNAEEEFGGLGVRQSTLNYETGSEMSGDATPDSRLRFASIHCDTKLMQKAIYDGANVNGCDELGQTALHFAVDRGNIECVQLLIEHDADVNTTDNDGIGVLLTAVMAGHVDVAKLLLEAGADPDIQDEDGETPRTWAGEDENSDMIALFANYPKK